MTVKAKNILDLMDRQISHNPHIQNLYVKPEEFAILANHLYKNKSQRTLVQDTLCYRGFSIIKTNPIK